MLRQRDIGLGNVTQTVLKMEEPPREEATTRADEDGARAAITEPASHKGAAEWTSSRSRGRRGTPPPVPRRATENGDLPPRPRTPAQVLATRAHSAAKSTPDGAVEEHDTLSVASEGAEKTPEQAIATEKDEEKDEAISDASVEAIDSHAEASATVDDTLLRRMSAQLSVASDAYVSEYSRDERVDTSTVEEESVYDDEYDDGEEDEAAADGDSVGTSDEYVNIHADSEQHSHTGDDESYTPDNTPPPSPPRTMLPPPPLASEWVKYLAESGHEYYYNTKTHVSQWTRPASYALLSPTASGATVTATYEEENQQQAEAAYPSHLDHLSSEYYAATHAYVDRLFLAVTKNDETAQLQEILRYEVDGNVLNAAGLTPLHVAVQHGNARGAAMLLDYGVLVDGPTTGLFTTGRPVETPLVMACRTNHPSLVRLLIRYGASIYTRDADGNSVLHIAIRCWSDEVLQCLLSMDSTAAILNLRNADDETPLHLAARHGNANAVRALLAGGASVDVEDAQGRTPLVVSIMENRVDCAQLLQQVSSQADGDGSGFNEAATKHDEGPAMYDYPVPRKSTDQTDSESRGLLHGLELYLTQLLENSTSDVVLGSTVRQYVDLVQKELAAKTAAYDQARQREETLLSEIDQLTTTQSTASDDLAREREEKEQLRQRLETREVEFTSLQAAYDSLSSRSSMLESIARSSQDKLRRERAEHARQEEYWNQTIDNSLRENAALLQSVQSMQEAWPHHQYAATADTTGTTVDQYTSVSTTHQYSYSAPDYATDDPVAQDPSITAYAYDTTEYQATYDPEQANYPTMEPLAATKADDPPIPASRVDAVWNRFFENVSRVAEAGDKQSQTRPPATQQASMLPPASAIFASIRRDNKAQLRQLLRGGVSPNVRDLGEKGTPLHLATELGDLEAVMLLCEYGANVESRDENGSTPLLVACAQGHYDCTKFLLQSAANQSTVNSNRDSALHLAAWDGSVECVEILLEYDVDVLATNAMGLTALANVKTRSPLRHRFEDLAMDHPMTRTLRILEVAEAAVLEREREVQSAVEDRASQPKREQSVATAVNASSAKPAASTTATSWGRWIIGSVFGTATPQPPTNATDNDDDDDDDVQSEFEEAESSPSKFGRAYVDDLRPPPEIEAELRRAPLSPPSAPLPPPPPEIVAALERRKLGGTMVTNSVTRFASPPPPATKKSISTTPTGVRSRYVDTFNM